MPKKPYISQEYTLVYHNVPSDSVSEVIDRFAKRARSGGKIQPPSIVNYESDSVITDDNEEGTEDVVLTFVYQCHGGATADVRRFAQRSLARVSGDLDGVTIEVKPGVLLEKYMVPDVEEDQDDESEVEEDADELAEASV